MSPAPRLALFYAAVFLLVGIQLPFWPVFLAGRGLGAGEIGFVLAAALWVKVLVNPLAGLIADRSDRRRAVMMVLAAGNFAGFLLFVPTQGLWPLLLVNALTTATASALLPLGETLALGIAYARRLDYGRIRLWGSVSFIVASLGAGAFLAARSSEIVLALLIGAAAINVLACAQLPAPVAAPRRTGRSEWRRLLLDRRQLLFLLAATAIQASHSVYYGFGTLHWTALGYSAQTIGWLWAEGVIAEIALFAYGATLLTRLGPARLLVLAGGAGIVRWSLMAGALSLPPLLIAQALHALTFGAAHLGAMHFMARALPAEWSATGQSLYSATVSGIGFGVVMAFSGTLYGALGGGAYLVMAGIAGLGAAAGFALSRCWQGGLLTATES
jgi:MFS transporter, PPP family, 3-phenylpropionic acid transporter